jgi:hypothetical protein
MRPRWKIKNAIISGTEVVSAAAQMTGRAESRRASIT